MKPVVLLGFVGLNFATLYKPVPELAIPKPSTKSNPSILTFLLFRPFLIEHPILLPNTFLAQLLIFLDFLQAIQVTSDQNYKNGLFVFHGTLSKAKHLHRIQHAADFAFRRIYLAISFTSHKLRLTENPYSWLNKDFWVNQPYRQLL